MGYIKFVYLVMYVWYLKCFFSYIVNFLDKFFNELEDLVYCGVWFDWNFDFIDLKWEIVILFNLIGMFLFDMFIGRSNMKFRIRDVFKMFFKKGIDLWLIL